MGTHRPQEPREATLATWELHAGAGLAASQGDCGSQPPKAVWVLHGVTASCRSLEKPQIDRRGRRGS